MKKEVFWFSCVSTNARFCTQQGGEDDLDALLAKFALEDKLQAIAVTEDTNAPSARVYSSFTPVSSQQVQIQQLHVSFSCVIVCFIAK